MSKDETLGEALYAALDTTRAPGDALVGDPDERVAWDELTGSERDWLARAARAFLDRYVKEIADRRDRSRERAGTMGALDRYAELEHAEGLHEAILVLEAGIEQEGHEP